MLSLRSLLPFLPVICLLLAAARGEALTLSDYLAQVRGQNESYQGAVEKKEGARGRENEKEVLLAPTLFSNVQLQRDSKLPLLPLFTYQRIDTQNYSLGVSKLTSFGMQAKLYYALDYTAYINSSLGAFASGQGIPLAFWDARPVLELTQSLWQNGFGRTVAANQELIAAQAKAEAFGAEAELRQTLLDAESAYWRLAIARETVQIEKKALAQADSIYQFVSRRAQMNLGERADTLQARAALEARQLELRQAEDEERAAARNFNLLRDRPAGEVSEGLSPLPWDELEKIHPPPAHARRADVKAAEAQARAAEASSRLTAEKDKPNLDFYGSLALNGRSASPGSSLSNSYIANRPTMMVGMRFAMPLDFNEVSEARRGALHEEHAAQLSYRQKERDGERQWDDLTARLSDARERLRLTRLIAEAQRQKLEYERKRLRAGRTTTYQVLLFEQDYSGAELARTRAAAEVLTTNAQLKLYEGENG